MIIYDNNYNRITYDNNRGDIIIGIRVPEADIEPYAIKYLIEDIED